MWVLSLLACAGDRKNEPLPLVLDVLEANRAPPPAPIDGDPYPEVLSVLSGGDGDPWWAHGRGYLKASAADCWDAMRDPEVVVDRREIDEWSVSYDVDSPLDVSFILHNTARDVITVSYDLTWLHELQQGSEAAPEQVVGVWDKTDGTAFIDLLTGSFLLRPIGANLTEIELIEHLKAPLRDDATLVSYLQDLHASVAARIHGRPLPAY